MTTINENVFKSNIPLTKLINSLAEILLEVNFNRYSIFINGINYDTLVADESDQKRALEIVYTDLLDHFKKLII